MKLYICGPMSGLPALNYPAFHAAADLLRSDGHEVINPAENPEPPCKSWRGYMRMSISQVSQCEAIAVLPGWEKSRGATLEMHIARQLDLIVMELS